MLLSEATKTRHYRVHLSASNCTLLSIVVNIILLLFVLHAYYSPCHIESTHMSTLLTPPAHSHNFQPHSHPMPSDEATTTSADDDLPPPPTHPAVRPFPRPLPPVPARRRLPRPTVDTPPSHRARHRA